MSMLREIAIGLLCGSVCVAGIAGWRRLRAARRPVSALVIRLDDAWHGAVPFRPRAASPNAAPPRPRWLCKPVGELRFNSSALDAVLERVAARAGVTIVPPRRRLDDPRDPPAPLDFSTRGITVGESLDELMMTPGAHDEIYRRAYVAEGGVIEFNDQRGPAQKRFLRVYDLRPLLDRSPASERYWRERELSTLAYGSPGASLWAGRLFVLLDPAGHDYLEETLRMLSDSP